MLPSINTRRVKRSGRNVARKAALDAKLIEEKQNAKREQYLRFTTEWAEKLQFSARKGRLKRAAKQMEEELICANKEIIILRRERLRALLEAEHDQYIRELDAKGLAIMHVDDY